MSTYLSELQALLVKALVEGLWDYTEYGALQVDETNTLSDSLARVTVHTPDGEPVTFSVLVTPTEHPGLAHTVFDHLDFFDGTSAA